MAKDESRSLARVEKLRAAAEQIAAELRANKDAHQEYAAIKAGIGRRTYYEYLSKEGPEYEVFQSIVVPAIHEQAAENLKDAERAIGCVEAGSGPWASWHKWLLEKKYRKLFGDLAQEVKLEVSGPDGGPVRIETSRMSDAELEAAIAAERAKAGGDGDG